uniref:Uncharacterized protein n=1 Tax=Mycena chlorophos TaxID=658473 RepID=A0ABQ0LHD0_MYCCL|nr:predicted protein [Mycena chlorophos]
MAIHSWNPSVAYPLHLEFFNINRTSEDNGLNSPRSSTPAFKRGVCFLGFIESLCSRMSAYPTTALSPKEDSLQVSRPLVCCRKAPRPCTESAA